MDTEKNDNIIQEQNPLPTETIPNESIKPEKTKFRINKKNKIILLIVIAILSLVLGLIIAYQVNPEDSQTIEKEEKQDVEAIEEDVEEEEEEDDDGKDSDEVSQKPYNQYRVYTDAKTTDVSEYTDIVLNNYDGLSVHVFESDDENFLKGIVSYNLAAYTNYEDESSDEEKEAKYGPDLWMKIVNSKNIANSIQRENFENAKSVIQTKNLKSEDILRSGTLPPFVDNYSGAGHPLVKEITNIQYSGTENTFAILTLGGNQGEFYIPRSDNNIGPNFTIIIYAIKGDNLISLKSRHTNTAELGVSKERHMTCIDNQDGEYPNSAWLGVYDISCMINILKDTQYDAKIRELTNNLLDRFKLKSV